MSLSELLVKNMKNSVQIQKSIDDFNDSILSNIDRLENRLARSTEVKLSDIIANNAQMSERNMFWNTYQNYYNGIRTNYNYAFYGPYWNQNNFYPQSDIIMKGNNMEAFEFFNQYGEVFDFCQRLKDCNVTLDCSEATNLQWAFYTMYVTTLPEINVTSLTDLRNLFGGSQFISIEKIILKDDGTQTFYETFWRCSKLEQVVIEGIIGNSLSLSDCVVLNKSSITSFINALKEDAVGQTLTFSLTAVNKAFETVEDLEDGSTSQEWINLITSKSNQYNGNWTISLV